MPASWFMVSLVVVAFRIDVAEWVHLLPPIESAAHRLLIDPQHSVTARLLWN